MSYILGSVFGKLVDATDTSKTFDVNLSGASTGTTLSLQSNQTANRTLTVPDSSTTLVGTDVAQTLSNKTIDASLNTLSNIPNSSLISSSVTVNTGTGLTGGGAVSLGGTTNVSLSVPVSTTNGGTGINTSTAANGALLIGNGTGLSLSTLTSGSGISITNGSGSITINNGGVISFSTGTTGLTPSSPSTGAIMLGGVLGSANGGTGQSSYTIGDMLYASGATALSKLAASASGNALISGTTPSWGKINLGTHVSGTLLAAQAPAFTGDVTSSTGSLSLTIANSSVTNSKLANVPANTIKGNNTGSSVAPLDLTATEVTAMLNTFTSGLKGLAPSSGGSTTDFLRADGSWVSPGGSGSPGGANTNVQYNNSGSFAGSNAFNFVTGVNPVVNILGTNATTQLTVGGITSPNNSTLYTEKITSGSDTDCIRAYFNSQTPGTNSWIVLNYDGNTANIRMTDEDSINSPYIQFNVVGSGSYGSPEFKNIFGGRRMLDESSAATSGFLWRIGNNVVSTMDSQWFIPPSGTTAQRPTPSTGMFRYNTSFNSLESYNQAVWSLMSGVIDKNVVTQSFSATGATNLISYSVPATTLGTNGILRIKLGGIWNNASGGTRSFTLIISYGATTIYQDTSATVATANTVGWSIDLMFSANNSVSAQTLSGTVIVGATGATTTGSGNLGTGTVSSFGVIGGTSAENSNANLTFTLSVNLSNTGTTWTKYYHTIELL